MEDLNKILEQFQTFKETNEFNTLIRKVQQAVKNCNRNFYFSSFDAKDFMGAYLEHYYLPNEKLMNNQGKMEVAPAILNVWLELPDYIYDDYYDAMLEEYYSGEYDDECDSEESFDENYIIDKYVFDESFRREMQPVLEEIKDTIDTEFYNKVQ